MNILDKISSGFTYFDGGCGTILQAQGLQPGELPETWNILHSEIIQKMHHDYLCSGVNILKTNTFGANSLKFGDEGQFSLDNIIESAIDNARTAIRQVENGKSIDGLDIAEDAAKLATTEHYVALDVGPLGKLLKPIGDMEFEQAVSIFKQTIEAGARHGADLILVETMNDIYEAKAALLAAKEVSNLPVFLTCAYDETGKLLTGADPKTVVAVAEGLGVSAIGINCSLGPKQMAPLVQEISDYASVPVICNPNAGLPRTENGKTVFDVGPEDFADSMKLIIEAGAQILGGCCGTTPAHIKETILESFGHKAKTITEKKYTMVSSYTHSVIFDRKPILIGERINPTGKSKFKQALRDHNIDYILQEGLTQQEKKADILDVNVGLPEIDEVAMMIEVVCELQAVTDLPLQIDTTNVEAMEKALRVYNGKAMINSVNGKEEVMNAIFPLVQKYGGLCVALTIDEGGIPETADGRLAIAEKIYKKASEYGIKPRDIIVDPLCMSISAEPESANITLDALKLIRDKLDGKTSLGVSNISFGLPSRDLINGTFFTMAMQNGLSAAIMNPNSSEMMKAYYTFCALNAIDVNCGDYIEYASNLPSMVVATQAKQGETPGSSGDNNGSADLDPLTLAITKGLKDRAAALTRQYLDRGDEAIDIIDGFLIPALDIVGKGFEKKTVFLPQLLMSAEAASGAFDVIKSFFEKNGAKQEKKGKIIMATVKGDIHDIGKNIVKVLLDNYGYEVIDLGKDVAPELIVSTAKEQGIKLVGLSALMTTTVPAMEETIKQLRAEGLDVRVVVGGAVLTQEYADMIGADKYAKDAMETVRYAEEFFA